MSTRVRLTFPEELVREPVVAQLVRRFDVEPNIRRASVEAHEGWVICELDGDARGRRGRGGLARGDRRHRGPARRRRGGLRPPEASSARRGVDDGPPCGAFAGDETQRRGGGGFSPPRARICQPLVAVWRAS